MRGEGKSILLMQKKMLGSFIKSFKMNRSKLLLESRYFLNKSYSLRLSTGINVENNFEPSVLILKKSVSSAVSFSSCEFIKFLKLKTILLEYFSSIISVEECQNINIQFENYVLKFTEKGGDRILKIVAKKGTVNIALNAESFSNLLVLETLIKHKIEQLRHIDVKSHYSNCLHGYLNTLSTQTHLTLHEFVLKEKLENKASDDLITAMLEILLFHERNIYRDIALIKIYKN